MKMPQWSDSVSLVIWEEDEPMMGMQAAPEQLFYDFCLEDHVPGDNMLRRIDDFLDLDDSWVFSGVGLTLNPDRCELV
jgi:hypothetical protein